MIQIRRVILTEELYDVVFSKKEKGVLAFETNKEAKKEDFKKHYREWSGIKVRSKIRYNQKIFMITLKLREIKKFLEKHKINLEQQENIK